MEDKLYSLLGSKEVVSFIMKNNFIVDDNLKELLLLKELTIVILERRLKDFLKEEPKAKELFETYDKEVNNYYGVNYHNLNYGDYFNDIAITVINDGKLKLLIKAIENNMIHSL